MKNISEAVRVLEDAEVILASKLLEDSHKVELLDALETMFPPELMSSNFHKVVRDAIRQGRGRCAEEQGRKAEGPKEQAEVAPQGAKGQTKAPKGKTQGVAQQG